MFGLFTNCEGVGIKIYMCLWFSKSFSTTVQVKKFHTDPKVQPSDTPYLLVYSEHEIMTFARFSVLNIQPKKKKSNKSMHTKEVDFVEFVARLWTFNYVHIPNMWYK